MLLTAPASRLDSRGDTLPNGSAQAVSAPLDDRALKPGTSESAGTILVVDDIQENLSILSRMLVEKGYSVHSADCGQAALDSVRATLPDLILLDVRLPDLDGYEVCARLKAQEASREIPVIFLSALRERHEILRGFEVGGVDYVVKPFHPDEVLARVHTHLELRRLRLRLQSQMSEMRRAEEELRESREKVRTVFDNVKVGIMLLDTGMRVLETNRQLETWFPEICAGRQRPCYVSIGSRDADGPCQGCPCILSLADGKTHEASIEFGDPGHERVYRLVAAPIRDSAGNVVAVIDLVEDVTERLSLEHQVRVAQRLEAVGRLAGGVAHDFNNLVTIINGYVGFAMEGVAQEDPMWADLLEIRRAGERAATLTRQLLAFSQKQVLSPAIININDVVIGMAKMLGRIIGEDVDLRSEIAPDLATILMDPGQLEQMIVNLVVNSRDAMPLGGALTIATANVELDEEYARTHPGAVSGAYVRLSVSDTGHGMDRATQERMFEPFFTTKEAGIGTGLGLSTVYGIVRQSGGYIDFDSEAGKGTVFRLYFPRMLLAAAPQSGASALDVDRNHETLLVVEDEKAVRAMAGRILSAAGYKVLTAANASEAMDICHGLHEPIHLVLADVVMPDVSGPELARRLRALRPETRFLYVSGYAGGCPAGSNAPDATTPFLAKPFGVAELTRKVRQVLDHGKDEHRSPGRKA